MPEYVKAFLESLNDQQRNEVWLWADTSDVQDQIIEIVATVTAPHDRQKTSGGVTC